MAPAQQERRVGPTGPCRHANARRERAELLAAPSTPRCIPKPRPPSPHIYSHLIAFGEAIREMSLLRCEHMLNRHLNPNLAGDLQPGGIPAPVCLQ